MIDRLCLQGSLMVEEAAVGVRTIIDWLEAIDLVLLRPPVLSRASEPMPMPLGPLDALHLATALIWRDHIGPLPTLVMHDTALGTGARVRLRRSWNLKSNLTLRWLTARGRTSGDSRPVQPGDAEWLR